MSNIRKVMLDSWWFQHSGAYVLFDGQFGSTGKGLLAGVIAQEMGDYIDVVTTNAGPNSGHTAYYGDEKIMTQQIPVASVILAKQGQSHRCHLNAGAIVDLGVLGDEIERYKNDFMILSVDPSAAVIRAGDYGEAQHIASTGKGVGAALARKIMRQDDAVMAHVAEYSRYGSNGSFVRDPNLRVFIETAQGFSLGINSGFYPYTTSRECTVMQALADAHIPPAMFRRSIVSLRTYPIRVGNTEQGTSGPGYNDQKEITWGELGVEPELTTVTKRVRRVFTWSWEQYDEMLGVNRPNAIFLNFCNYMADADVEKHVGQMVHRYTEIIGRRPDFVLLGYGPKPSDVRLFEW